MRMQDLPGDSFRGPETLAQDEAPHPSHPKGRQRCPGAEPRTTRRQKATDPKGLQAPRMGRRHGKTGLNLDSTPPLNTFLAVARVSHSKAGRVAGRRAQPGEDRRAGGCAHRVRALSPLQPSPCLPDPHPQPPQN